MNEITEKIETTPAGEVSKIDLIKKYSNLYLPMENSGFYFSAINLWSRQGHAYYIVIIIDEHENVETRKIVEITEHTGRINSTTIRQLLPIYGLSVNEAIDEAIKKSTQAYRSKKIGNNYELYFENNITLKISENSFLEETLDYGYEIIDTILNECAYIDEDNLILVNKKEADILVEKVYVKTKYFPDLKSKNSIYRELRRMELITTNKEPNRYVYYKDQVSYIAIDKNKLVSEGEMCCE